MNGEKKQNDLTKQLINKLSHFFEGKKDRELAKGIAEYVVRGSLWTACSFLMSSCTTLFSTYPLGLALLCGKSSNVLFVFLGCVFSAFSMQKTSAAYIICYTAVLLLRYTVSKYLSDEHIKTFSENYLLRCITSLTAAFVLSIIICFSEGFSLSSFGGLVFMCATAFGLSFLFCGLEKKSGSIHYVAGFAAFAFCIVLAVGQFGFFGYSLGITACSAMTVYVSLKFELLPATVISLICGLACKEPILAPAFALIALFHGLTDKLNKKLSLPLSLLFGAIYSFWTFKAKAFSYVLPDLFCGALIILPLKYFGKVGQEEPKKNINDKNKEIENELNKVSEKLAREDSGKISDNMSSLSQMLTSLSDNLKYPGYDEVYRMCDEVCTNNCISCRQKKKCLNKPDENKDILARISRTLCETGYITSADIPREMTDNCKSTKVFLQDINSEYGLLIRSKMSSDKTRAFAYGYGCVAKLISENTKTREAEMAVDLELSDKAAEIAKKLKIDCDSIFIFGNRRKTVIAKGINDIALNMSGNTLKKEFSSICSLPMSTPYIEYTSGKWKMKLESIPTISCKYTCLSKPKGGEDVCGDTVKTFYSTDGYFYAVLSDGMGSGRQAALVSRICCSFTEKLALSGGSLKTVVETINNYMLGQNYETSSTLDLLRVDLYQSKVCFVKSGAVSSMIIRNGHVFRISSATLPLGVVRDINAEQTSFSVLPGDYIILLSDGVAPDLESCLLTADYVEKNRELPIEALAQSILNEASLSKRRSDDMSVVIVKIEDAL